MQVRFRLPDGRQFVVSQAPLTIGRDPSCHVCLPEANALRPCHIKLSRLAGRWLVESLGDWQFRVGEHPPATKDWIRSGEAILLSESGPEIIFEEVEVPATSAAQVVPQQAGGTESEVRERPVSGVQALGQFALCPKVIVGLAALLASGLALASLLWLTNRPARPLSPSGSPPFSSPSQGTADSAAPLRQEEPQPPGSAAAEVAEQAALEEVTTAAPARPAAEAIYWLVVSTTEGDESYRVGSAWAVEPQTLVTTGSVIMALRELMADRFPVVTAFCPASQQSVPVTASAVLPAFEDATREFAAIRRDYDATLEQIQATSLAEAELSPIRDKLLDLRQRGVAALERQTFFDLGVLRLSRQAAATLSPAPQEVPLRPKLKLTMYGAGFDAEDPWLDAAVRTDPQAAAVRVRQLISLDESPDSPRRLQFDLDAGQPDVNRLGMPVLLPDGRVLAMYSRPTPSEEPDQPPSADRFDAVLVHAIDHLTDAIRP